MPEQGEKVKIIPAPQHCPAGASRSMVIADPSSGRFLNVAGETVEWNQHHAERLRQGEIVIVSEKKSAQPVKES